ncbi:glycosyltransferase [Bacillus sp. H-16]|uniref:glycosyltransferase n=1 Tax=Alteribacter salitolerans TaxID=2912333 RepID=UPI001964BE38|nr:glycosyltransferase [Alteribacter salitolerans]MBM7095811.1 glycosyltransferase [Alteribacter salitolerans]
MLRMFKKGITNSVDLLLYKVLSTKQKQQIANLFTQEQKNRLKRIIKPGTNRNQVRKIERLKYRLYNLGFTKKGLKDLEDIVKSGEDAYLTRLAAWELATWHANTYSVEGAKKCLRFIDVAIKSDRDKSNLRRAAILKAESYNLLGESGKAKQLIEQALSLSKHPDLYLAAASLEGDASKRIDWINKALEKHDYTEIFLKEGKGKTLYDRIGSKAGQAEITASVQPRVTVVVPAYNAGESIKTAIESLLTQTWENLEVLVVDDYSTDNTVEIVQEYVEKDPRVTLIKGTANNGAYVSRNLALKQASGDFVTINDADDWSHPQKIEVQARHLMKNPQVIGNFSQQARATEDLKFYRRGKPGIYIFKNMSSLMFRRKEVMSSLGYWDCVRFAGDSEFLKRLKVLFGEKAIVELKSSLLSFQRQSDSSLTGHSAFGFPGYFMGVRKEYDEANTFYHQTVPKEKLYYEFPQKNRPFPAPEPMWPKGEKKQDGARHFDVIIASEFRLLGGTNMSNIEEIKAQKAKGLRTGLVQLSRYDLNSVDAMNPKVREWIDGDKVQVVSYGEEVSCDVLIVRHPPILQEWQKYIPTIEAKHTHVIVNQPPKRDYSDNGETLYTIDACVGHMQEYFGSAGVWAPIGPQIRDALLVHHEKELNQVEVDEEDWVNIIDVSEWRRSTLPRQASSIKVGRHSRDQYVKWPNDKDQLLKIYPDSNKYEIHVLGGCSAPKKVLGNIPLNWKVKEFGEIHPKDFLADLDVFVYYTHPDWVEAFGRVIFEAMAAGVPVIIPPSYKELFGEAAIYAEPDDVQEKINELMKKPQLYNEQVEKAFVYVNRHFGYEKHASRLESISNGKFRSRPAK